VWTLDEAEYYQKQGNWPPGGGNDPYFRNNVLLLHGDGTNGAQNNTFLDGSTNNFTITRNGNTTQGSFDPYVGPGCWSNYLNGTTDYLSIPDSDAFYFGTGNFTIETWMYLNSSTGGRYYTQYVDGVNQVWGSASSGGVSFQMNSGGSVLFALTALTTLSTGVWYHIATVRNGNTITIYVNGVSINSGTYAGTYPNIAGPLLISTYNGTSEFFPGYLSNYRVVKGVAVYTANFTPSTTPLVATPQTVLLTCNNNGFIDQSAMNNIITRNGSPQVSKFSPFTLYQTVPTSYSGYFDGTGDYLSIPYNASLSTAGGSSWTMEMWAYPTSFATNPKFLAAVQGTTFDWIAGTGFQSILYINTSGNVLFDYYNGAGANNTVTSPTVLSLNAWTHIAVVFDNITLKIFINGALSVSSAVTLSTQTGLTAVNIGGTSLSASRFLTGSISNFRFARGVAVYTAAFTPSTAPLTATTTVSSSQSNSVAFDGSGDYLSVPDSTAFTMGAGDFTIECWVYVTTIAGSQVLIGTCDSAGNQGSMSFILQLNSGTPRIGVGYAGTMYYATAASTISTNQWYHIAGVRNGANVYVYVNGVQSTALNMAALAITDSSQIVGIGRNGNYNGEYVSGFISNLRITKGQALYTTTFTPSTTPLTTTSQGATASNVSLLTCQDRLLEDNSNNYFAVTAFGDARPSSANPFVSTNGIGGTSYSGSFNGSSQYLTLASNAAFTFGTGDFTIEGWVYLTGTAGNYTIYDSRTAGTSICPLIYYQGGNIITYLVNGSNIITGPAIIAYTWHHVAICRSGTSTKMFVNGAQVGSTYTDTNNYTSGISTIARNAVAGGGTNLLPGNISNLRIVKGQALYTANFTPTTSPLTTTSQGATAANVSLLTCQNTTFIDNSPNAFAITNNGTTLTTTFNPYSGGTSLLTCQSTTFIDNSAIPQTLTANGDARPRRANPFVDTVTGPTPYDITTYGGSAYFDGAGDNLTLPAPSNLALGTGDFTWETWIYFNTLSVNTYIYDTSAAGDTTATGRFIVGAFPGGYLRLYTGALTTTLLASPAGVLTTNTWLHIVISRSGTTGYMFVNGALITSGSVTTNFLAVTGSGTNRPVIGANGYDLTGVVNGYISNLRVVKGTALYTTPFVPPTAPVTAVTNTQLLVNGTNAGIFDNTTTVDLETVNSAQISTSTVKYGTGSMSFNGLNSYLYSPHNPALNLGTGDMTVECWLNLNSTAGTQTIAAKWQLTNESWIWQFSSTAITFVYATVAASTFTWSPAINTWYHVAITKSGNSLRCFVNGTQVGSTITNTGGGANSTSPFTIGVNNDGPQQYLNGYIDDFRITKGYARYTANFTPPAGPFANF
jgi:hypothetical protein